MCLPSEGSKANEPEMEGQKNHRSSLELKEVPALAFFGSKCQNAQGQASTVEGLRKHAHAPHGKSDRTIRQHVKNRVVHDPAWPSQDVLKGDAAEEEREIACLVSSTTLPHQNSQPGGRGRQMARSKVLSGCARNT